MLIERMIQTNADRLSEQYFNVATACLRDRIDKGLTIK